jgi:hypothetical protein
MYCDLLYYRFLETHDFNILKRYFFEIDCLRKEGVEMAVFAIAIFSGVSGRYVRLLP